MKERPQPQRYSELHDPKLPIIHGASAGQSLQQIHPAPIPSTTAEG